MIPGDYAVPVSTSGVERRGRMGVVKDGRPRWGESFIWDLGPQSAPRPSVRVDAIVVSRPSAPGGTCTCLCGGVQGPSIALVRNDSAQAQPGLLL